ncbi:MAG: glycosyltransferase family 39 protein [Vicinamibacterales bacterium]
MLWTRVRSSLVFLAVCWVVLFWRLGHVGLMDDEAHYARLTQEMAAHGDWMAPRLNGVAFIDKPVFFHWVQGVTTALIPDAELGARLPSALAAAALFGVIAWLGTTCAGIQTGRRAWLLLATMPSTFLLGRTGFMDMLFSALLFGSVAFITRGLMAASTWGHVGAVVCLSLAILTKGPVAAGLVGLWLVALWFWCGAPVRALAGLRLWTGVLGVLLLAMPWFLWMYVHYGDLFVDQYLGQGHMEYLAPRASASSSQWTFYARMFMTSFFPWSLVAVGYGIDTARRARRGVQIPLWEAGLWLWIVVILTVFTLVPFRVDRYIYPAAPACCLLAVRGWLAASAQARWREFAATRAAVAVVALAFIGAGVALWWSFPSLAVPLPGAVNIAPVVMVIGGFAIIAAMVRRGVGLPKLTRWPIVTLLAVYASLVFVGLPIVRAGLPIEQVGRFIADRSGKDEPVAVLGLDRWEGGLAYYVHNPPQLLRSSTEAERFARTPGPRWLVTRRGWQNLATGGCVTLSLPAIVGTTGRGIRKQVWEDVLVIRYDANNHLKSTCPVP